VDLARLLAESLRRLRHEAGLSQVEMARRLGVSRPTLTRLEQAGQNVTLATLGGLCRALGCRPGDLFEPGRLSPSRLPRGGRRRSR
jgi:transcriptional regulator with XRE-family HTH domain